MVLFSGIRTAVAAAALVVAASTAKASCGARAVLARTSPAEGAAAHSPRCWLRRESR